MPRPLPGGGQAKKTKYPHMGPKTQTRGPSRGPPDPVVLLEKKKSRGKT